MIYTLIIRPSRVELVLKTFSADYNKLTEKRLISKEFSFRFNREIIDTGAYYKSFYRVLADILQPYKKDIKQLQVSLRSSFFQTRSIQCEKDMISDQEYLNWEVDKSLNDVNEHFIYGTFYEKSITMLHLFILRKSVKDYFNEILRKILSEDINFTVGYDFITESKQNVFIDTDEVINKPFGAGPSSVRMWGLPTEKIRAEVKFKRTLISSIILSLLITAFYLTYFQSSNIYELYNTVFKKDPVAKEAMTEIQIAKKDTAEHTIEVTDENIPKDLSSEEKFLAKLLEEEVMKEEPVAEIKTLNIYDTLDSLIFYDPKSLIFENNQVLVQFHSKRTLEKFIKIASTYGLKILNTQNDFLSLQIEDHDKHLKLTKKVYKKTCEKLKLKCDKPYLIIKKNSEFYKLTDILQSDNLIFKKIVISNRGKKLFLAVYFD